MGETNHRPRALYLFQPTQEKVPEAARLFDLSKHRGVQKLAKFD